MITTNTVKNQQSKIEQLLWEAIAEQGIPQQASQVEIFPLTTRLLHTLAGMLNLYTYCIAKKYDCIDKGGINGAKLRQVAELEDIELEVPVEYINSYLKEHWPKACSSDVKIRKMRRFMRDRLELFTFTDQQNGAIAKTKTPPTFRNVSLQRMLIAFEQVEKILIDGAIVPEGIAPGSEEALKQVLPEHLGAFTICMFNEVFAGVASFRREEVKTIAPKNEPVFNLVASVFNGWKDWYQIIHKTAKKLAHAVFDSDEQGAIAVSY